MARLKDVRHLYRHYRPSTDRIGSARAVITLEGERDNKLMNIEVVTASIAHEVRQPLAAIAANGGATLQFLQRVPLTSEGAEILNQ